MQMRFNRFEGAYLTVYLSLVFAIILSLLLVLIESATIGAVRAQSELVADLGVDSVFAEYNRELLNQYELFFVDTSYGTDSGGVGKVELRLKSYMEKNMNPDKDLNLIGATTLLKLKNPYLEIEEVSYASDENGAVWKAQAIHYMKAVYGGDFISTVKSHLDIVNGNALNTRDVAGEVAQQKIEFEEALAENEIIEFGSENEDGFSYQKLSDMVGTLLGNGVLSMVLPEGASISGTTINQSEYLSSRMKSGRVNKGIGLHEGIDNPNGIDDELIYGEYLMKMCGNYTDIKEEGLLDYQIEYILYGQDSDAANLRASALTLFSLRAVSNLLYLYGDSTKRNEVEFVSTIICDLLVMPQLTEVLTGIIMGVWALAESVADVRDLLSGGKVPLIKDSNDWHLGLSGIFNGELSGSSKGNNGLSYEDYLRVLLALMNKNDKALRSLDIVEMDIRQTQGNADFRIDRCIDYMKVSFGFSDAQGHEFVFRKTMCFE